MMLHATAPVSSSMETLLCRATPKPRICTTDPRAKADTILPPSQLQRPVPVQAMAHPGLLKLMNMNVEQVETEDVVLRPTAKTEPAIDAAIGTTKLSQAAAAAEAEAVQEN